MSADRPPARDWFDLVSGTAAVKGWSIADLCSRSGVARSTVYNWRDNSGRPQAKSVNAVADALGIDRERALRLAGIIGARPGGRSSLPRKVLAEIMADDDLTGPEKEAVIDAMETRLAKERGEDGGPAAAASAPEDGPERRRPAS